MNRIIALLTLIVCLGNVTYAEEIILTPEQVQMINESVETGEPVDIITKKPKNPDFLQMKAGTYNYIKSVKKFQAMNNLPITGKYDELTRANVENNEIAIDIVDPSKVPMGELLVVNKDLNMLTIYIDRLPVDKFAVSTGTSNRTPSIKTQVYNKVVNPAWGGMGGKYTPTKGGAKNNPLGKRWIALDNRGQIGIHGTLEENWLGKYRTQGCIRMFNSDVEQIVFPQVAIGTKVWIGNTGELNNWGIQQLSKSE